MVDISKRCILIKGLPADATERELKKCLENRNLQVLNIHSHLESQTDKRWVLLLPDFGDVIECIKQGSWVASLSSREITVTPDYCSECIVPRHWAQEEEDEESSDESWCKVESSTEQPHMTQVLVAKVQTADIDAHEKSLQLSSEDDTVTVFAEEIYQNAQFPPDMPLSRKVRPKDDAASPQSPQMVGENRDYTPFKSGSIPITQMKYTGKEGQTGSRENLTKDIDNTKTQMKTYSKTGSINLSGKRNPWSSLLDPSVKNEDIDNQRKSGPGHEKKHLSSTPSTKKVGSDEDEEGQMDINEGPQDAWSDEDPTIHNERSLSPVKVPLPSGGLDQGMRFPLPDMEDKASREEIHQLTTEISSERMTMPEQQHIIGRYVQNMTIRQPLTVVPSQNMNMPTPAMMLPQPHAEAASERQTFPQTNIGTQVPNMIMPQPITEVPVQSMPMDPLTPRSGNSSILAGQVYSAVPTWHVMPGQMNSSGVTDRHRVPPGHTGPYRYPLQTMPFIPPGGYQMNYGQIPWGHYGLTHLQPSPAVQHVQTTSSQPSCPPSQASSMSFMPPLRPQVGYQPPQGCVSGLEKPVDIAGQWSAGTQAGPVEDGGSYMNISGKTQNINYTEYVEKTKPTDRHRGDDSDMKKDRPQSQIYPKLAEDPFQYNKDSLKNKDHHNRGNLMESQRISQDDRHDAVEGFKSRSEGSSDAQVDHIKRGMNKQSNKRLEGPPSEDDTEQFFSLDSEGYERTDDAGVREIESKPKKENAKTPRMIRVLGLAKSVSKDALEMFFENKKRSGGGEIDSMEWGRSKGEAFITFKDPSVVQNVIEKQNREPFYLEKMKLTVEGYVPPPSDPLRLKETDDADAREIKSKAQKENAQTPRMIRVLGLAKSVSKDALEMFFENKKRSGGGEIDNMEWGRNKREAFITFKDPSVVHSVLKKQEGESFYMENMKLTVEGYVPPPPDPHRLFLKNLSPKVTDELLILYLESRCKAIPTEILFGRLPGTALVTFSELPDVELLLRKVKEKPLEGQYIEVTRVPITCCIQLTGLPLTTSRDTVELYFENKKRSGGGAVADVKFGRDKQSCVVSFENAEDAERVCMRPHTIDNKDIKVCLYYECLDDDLDAEESCDFTHKTKDTVDEFKLPDPVELKDLNLQILRFLLKNEKHRHMFENNMSNVYGVAKWPSSFEDYVIIECNVKVEDKNAGLLLKDWGVKVVDKVKSFVAGIDAAEFNLIEMAWLRVFKELQTITIDNPEDVGVFVEQETYKITIVGPKAAVEKLQKTILVIITKVETQIQLEKQTVTEKKSMKTYEMTLLRATLFKQDIEKVFPGLQFNVNQREKNVIFVGQADIVQKAVERMHKKLRSFVSRSMPMSKAAKDLLFVREITDYIKQKMKSQKIIGVWDVVRREEVRMIGRDENEVQKAIQIVRNCILEKEILLDEIKARAVQGQQWSQLVQGMQEKHAKHVSIETTTSKILVVAVDGIFQDVFDEINSYLEKHSVQELFLSLEPVRVKFIKIYKRENIKALEKKYESSYVKLSVIDYGDQKGIKINGTQNGCKVVKTELAEMAKNVITKEIMLEKVGLKELLQSSRGRDQLHSIESRCKCFIEMKASVPPSSLQLEGASGGHSSGSEDDAGQSYKPKARQSSSGSGGTSINVGGIKVSVVKGELAVQRVDVIVNSTSQKLDLNTGFISKTILQYGGDIIQRECRQQYPDGINPGEVVVTSGGNLSCKNVYHGCLQMYDGSQGNSMKLMGKFIINCLAKAEKSGLQSIAFPALGTGNLGFPADEVGNLMMQCIKALVKTGPANLHDISLVVYPSDLNSLKAFTAVFGGTAAPSASIGRSASSSSNISIVRGICRCTLPHLVVLEIVQGDITKETTDVIVNSVLSDLNLSQGQVSKAILIAGGISIQQECQDKDPELKKNGFVVTSPGKLPCKMIIHMAARNNAKEWEDMIEKVLFQTDKKRCQSISFPALGTGGKGLSTEDIAQAMHTACTEFAKSQPLYLKKIRVVLFQETMLTAFVQAIKDHSSSQGESRSSKRPGVGKSLKEKSQTSRLVFSITIDSDSNFKAAKKDLESFVTNEITEKEIDSPRKIILELLDRQVTKMEGMSQGNTIVSVKRRKGVIQVSGTHKEVLETYDAIVKYLHNIERDKMKAEQEKLKTQAASDLSLPSSWTKMAPTENMKCVTLNPSDQEYKDVSKKFLASAGSTGWQGAAYAYPMKAGHMLNYGSPGLTVIEIERVQNKTLYLQYKAKKRHMETQNKGVVNEKELWHGTAGTNIANISNNGFNRSYGGSGSHGAGTYFAVNASYSVSGYCNPDASGHRHIYLANVLTGDSVVAGSGTRVLPPKDPRYPHITYDSTTDNKTNPQMFVIFHDTQAYPSYHITFC